MPWLRGGTVAVTNGSTTVVGTNADFAANSRVGDAFVGPDGNNYEVGNVASATVISIIPAYKGATASGVTYAIMPVQGYPKALADAFNNINLQWGSKLAALGTTGNYDVLPVTKGGTGSATGAAALSALGVSDFAKTLLDDADASTARATLLAAEQTQGFIEGLTMTWLSATSIAIGAGSAYVPSVGKVVKYAGATITAQGVADVNTFNHVYLTPTGTIEQSIVAPVRYYNQAHYKTGDASRRYIGSLHTTTNAAGVTKFAHHPNDGSIVYTLASPQTAPFLLLSGGTVTAAFTTRSVAPPTAHTLEAAWQNTGTTVTVQFTPSDAGTPVGSGWVMFVMPGAIFNGRCPIAADGTITYKANGGGSASCYALGYYFDR